MGEIVNLRQVKKTRAKQDKQAEAEANRVRFGRTRAEKENDRRARERQERTVDGARRETDDE